MLTRVSGLGCSRSSTKAYSMPYFTLCAHTCIRMCIYSIYTHCNCTIQFKDHVKRAREGVPGTGHCEWHRWQRPSRWSAVQFWCRGWGIRISVRLHVPTYWHIVFICRLQSTCIATPWRPRYVLHRHMEPWGLGSREVLDLLLVVLRKRTRDARASVKIFLGVYG